MPTGTLTIADLQAVKGQSIAEFGLETIAEVVNRDVEAHNQIVEQLLKELCEITTDRQRRYGTSSTGEMTEVDEFGQAPTQKDVPGVNVGFPLRKYQYALGWTNDYFLKNTPSDLATQVLNAEKSDLQRITKEIKRAFYTSTNSTFNDRFVDKVDLPVKALVNADSANIPDGPNGETFNGATHTHYTAAASLDVADITAAINTVVEHGHGEIVKVFINKANETAFRGLTGFNAYTDPRLILGTNANQPGERLDISRLDNRAIGILDAAEIWVKPWAIAGYAVACDVGSDDKPLAFREHDVAAVQGLRVAANLASHPLYAEIMERYFGIGVWTRTNGAVHQFTNATYQVPTI